MRLLVFALLLASIAAGLQLRPAAHDLSTSVHSFLPPKVLPAVQLGTGWRLAPPQQLASIQTLEVRLPAMAVESEAVCQVAMLADHRGSFVWECRLGRGQTRLLVPLHQAAGWRDVDHDGAWSLWELASLRQVEIKLFDQAGQGLPLTGSPNAVWLTAGPSPARLHWLHPGPESMALGERWECRFDLADGTIDPWDPTASGLRLAWTDPSGKSIDLPPFLHQEFRAEERSTGEVLVAQGPKHLRVRARPTFSGIHTWHLRLGEATLASGAVTVGAGTPPRFLRIDPARPRWFLDPAGRTFQPIGWNVAYPADRPYGVDLRPYLPRVQRLRLMLREIDAVADAGGNCIRFWLSDWWGGLEWDARVDAYLGIGRWNLRHAWLVDQVLQRCEERGVAVLLTHLNHVRLSGEYGWPRHPYARRNGGFLDQPQDYWTDPRAAAAADAAVAAALARWADSPAVLAWDYMSESDLMAKNWPQARRHILARLVEMRRRDPWGHPSSNHICVQDTDPSLATEPGLDFFSSNAYPDTASLTSIQAEAVRRFAQLWAGANKPVLIAEYGGHWAGAPPAQMARDLEAGLWAGIGSHMAGAPLAWWWNVISADELGRIWRAASAYLAADDPAAEDLHDPGSWRERAARVACNQPVAAFSVGSDRVRRLILLAERALYRCEAEPPPCGPATVDLDGMQPGPCDLEIWDGIGTAPVRVERLVVPPDGRLTLRTGPFARICAMRLRPAGTAVAAGPQPEPVAAARPVAAAAGDLTWRLVPLVPAAPPTLADRLVAEMPIALPSPLGRRFPRVHLENGPELPCAWEVLDGGNGLLLRLPGSLSGPCVVTLADAPGPAWSFVPSRMGLLAEAVPAVHAERNHAAFVNLVATAANRTQPVRVEGIDQTDNPCGLGPSNVTTRYHGPLLLPAGAQVLAINCDDAMSVQLDGRPVVARFIPGGMDVENRPAQNRWRHTGEVETTAGFHELEVGHVQYGGAQLARLGWRWRASGSDDPILPGGPPTSAGTLATLPPWRCDGRIPLALEIMREGRMLARILPSAALELRSPRRRLLTTAVASADGRTDLRILPAAGWQSLSIAGTMVPVWSGNRYAREVSLTWRSVTDEATPPALETMSIDADLDLALELNGRALPVRRHAARMPVRWELMPADRGQGFRVLAGGVPLYEGTLPPAPGRIAGLGLRVDPSWFIRGLSSEQLLAHVEASLAPGGTVTLARGLDRGQRQVRDLLLRLRAIVRVHRGMVLDEERP